MSDRKCGRNARPEQDSIQRAQYQARCDLAPLRARDCGDSKYGGVGCHCWLRWPRRRGRHRRHR